MTPKQFKSARNKLGMTQADIATKLHLTIRMISKYETGASNVPPLVADMMKIMLDNRN